MFSLSRRNFIKSAGVGVVVSAFPCVLAKAHGSDPGSNAAGAATFENEYLTLAIGRDGRVHSVLDRQNDVNYLPKGQAPPFLTAAVGGTHRTPTECRPEDGRVVFTFAGAEAEVVVTVRERAHYLVFELTSTESSAGITGLTFANLVVTADEQVSGMSGVARGERFGVALRTLDLKAIGRVGGRPARLRAAGRRGCDLRGARVALVGCPAEKIRDVLKEVFRAEGVPTSPLGGPWALEAEANRGSYVFAGVSRDNVDDWIALTKKAGIAEIHFLGWEKTRGHYRPREDLFPGGLDGLKQVVERIHAASLSAGMHTLTGCISPNDPWVTPVPDPRLAADATFDLARPLDRQQKTLITTEEPRGLDTVWAYGSHGNVLRIGDELIRYSSLSSDPPGFTGCERGAFGTNPTGHGEGSKVQHLFVRYGSFLPDENSTLVDDVASAIAEVCNTCGFDMIYQDGSEGMPGGWYGLARMRRAIFEKIDHPVLVEASSWGYPSWSFHSRIGAWDYPNWGLKRFIDKHVRANESYRRTALLPAQLGWWALFGPGRDRDVQMPDEVEYLCVRALAYDMPMSFQAVRPTENPPNGRQDEYLEMIGRYERLRLSSKVPESLRAQLREPGRDFHLVEDGGGRARFRPADYARHRVTGLDNGTQRWSVHNRFAAQPLKLWLQALYSAEPYDSEKARLVTGFRSGEFGVRESAPGVSCSLDRVSRPVRVGEASGRFTARNTTDSRRGAWARVGKKFPSEMDLSPCDALSVWVHGDGGGELLNVQLVNPRQYYRAFSDHHIRIDFQGWRYFELLFRERDAAGYSEHVWPYPGHYGVYRAPLVRAHVSQLNLYFNDLPPDREVTCHLGPIRALRTKEIEISDPAVSIGERRVEFPAALRSGHYLEFSGAGDCRLCDDRGAPRGRASIRGTVPELATGENLVTFTCSGPNKFSTRARVTVVSYGELLAG